jgi:hypothetical protein
MRRIAVATGMRTREEPPRVPRQFVGARARARRVQHAHRRAAPLPERARRRAAASPPLPPRRARHMRRRRCAAARTRAACCAAAAALLLLAALPPAAATRALTTVPAAAPPATPTPATAAPPSSAAAPHSAPHSSAPRRVLFDTSAFRRFLLELFDVTYKFLDAELYAGTRALLLLMLNPLDSIA